MTKNLTITITIKPLAMTPDIDEGGDVGSDSVKSEPSGRMGGEAEIRATRQRPHNRKRTSKERERKNGR